MVLKVPKVPDSSSIANEDGVEAILGFYNDQEKFNRSLKTLLDGEITDTLNWEMVIVNDDDYSLILNSPYAYTVTATTSKSSTGTCTATFKIDGVSLGGTANSVSTSESTQAHTTANTGAVGTDLTVTISSNSGCEHAKLSVKFTRPLIV